MLFRRLFTFWDYSKRAFDYVAAWILGSVLNQKCLIDHVRRLNALREDCQLRYHVAVVQCNWSSPVCHCCWICVEVYTNVWGTIPEYRWWHICKNMQQTTDIWQKVNDIWVWPFPTYKVFPIRSFIGYYLWSIWGIDEYFILASLSKKFCFQQERITFLLRLWSITEILHGKMESICCLLHIPSQIQ